MGVVVPPANAATLLTSWVVDPLGVVLALALAGAYVVCVVRARRRGVAWHGLRTVAFMVLGIGSLVYATCGGLAVYRSSLFVAAAAQATVLSAVTPLGLALGDPVALVGKALGDVDRLRLRRALAGRVARVLMFPLVSSLLAAGSLIAVFFTGYLASSTSSVLVRDLLYVQLLVTGLLVVLPLLGEDMLPAWCTHPVRAVVAFADGLLDAIPGLLVMTAPVLLAPGVRGFADRTWGPAPAWDQKVGGGTMVAIAEAVGLPLLAAIIVSWVRADEADAREIDAALDALEVPAVEPGRERPWWETDPRYADRRHPGEERPSVPG